MAKRCHQCQGKLGLGARFRELWHGYAWLRLRFCSSLCEATHELEMHNARLQSKWFSYLARELT
jgi:hypothetical protein